MQLPDKVSRVQIVIGSLVSDDLLALALVDFGYDIQQAFEAPRF